MQPQLCSAVQFEIFVSRLHMQNEVVLVQFLSQYESTHHQVRMEEFYDASIEQRQHDIAHAKGFEIADHALSLYAHCKRSPCPYKSA